MSYDTIEAATLTVLRLIGGASPVYTTTNSARRDWRILAKGVRRAVVLMPGAVPAREVIAAPRRMRTVWQVNMDLYISYALNRELTPAINNLQTDTQQIMDFFDQYPTLNSTAGVIHAFIIGVSEPELWVGENRQWLARRLTLEVEERANITIAE